MVKDRPEGKNVSPFVDLDFAGVELFGRGISRGSKPGFPSGIESHAGCLFSVERLGEAEVDDLWCSGGRDENVLWFKVAV